MFIFKRAYIYTAVSVKTLGSDTKSLI